MPLSSFHDPDTLARAQRALGGAWTEIEKRGLCSENPQRDRTWLAYQIANLLRDDDQIDLIPKVVARFAEEVRNRG